jgi:hypothetical protein
MTSATANYLNESSDTGHFGTPRLIRHSLAYHLEFHMRASLAFVVLAIGSLSGLAFGAGSADTETVSRLSQSKLTLVDGIRQAAMTQGSPISAKFEFEDGKFWLSVYTAKAGMAADAEHNTLMELQGEANAPAWKPNVEVFSDKEHLTRSATQLTLMQLSKLDLAAIVEKAAASEKGTAYSAIPAVKNGKAVVTVKFGMRDGSSHSVDVSL